MRKSLFHIASYFVAAGLMLSACATPTPEVVVQTQVVPLVQTQVVKETQIVEVVPTAAPLDAAAVAAALPRTETLYFNGQQWGAVVG